MGSVSKGTIFQKNLYTLFQKEEEQSDFLEAELLEKTEDVDGFFDEVENNPRFVKFTIGDVINEISTDANSNTSQKEIERIYNNHLISEFQEVDGGAYYFKDKYGQILVFSVLDDVYPSLKKVFPELRSQDDRYGQCHVKSIDLIHIMEGESMKLVTGFHGGRAKEARYIHSWIEFEQDGMEFAIDFTQNILMPKDMYYYLEDSEPLTIISRKDVVDDHKKYIETFRELGIGKKFYCLYRHELINSIKSKESSKDCESEDE